jgi:hypothetical protein
MRNGSQVSLRKMTARAVVCGLLLKAFPLRKRAAILLVASQAFAAIVGWCFLRTGLCMRAVAGDAAELSLTSLIAAAQHHRGVVFEEVVVGGRLTPIRDPENPNRIVQGRSWTKIEIVFALLKHARVARLMAIHADIVCKPGLQTGRIYDARIAIL